MPLTLPEVVCILEDGIHLPIKIIKKDRSE